jgi:23S rRNA (cytidine1920-2'-O)/16S rRNA (cytidine1409-2'-O)-methyltransferase
MERIRLDTLLVQRGLAASRARARRLVAAGAVTVDGVTATKAGRAVPAAAELTLSETDIPYVSRAGLKLAAALDNFGLDPAGARVLDAGASTGGFTDCLLQRGADAVTAVDVGTDQLHPRLRQDPRVAVHEQTDIRAFEAATHGGPFPWLVADLSFLSLCHAAAALSAAAAPGATVLVLVKPQFEAGRNQVGRGGVVRNETIRQQALSDARLCLEGAGLTAVDAMEVPVAGEAGNREYFLYLQREGSPCA